MLKVLVRADTADKGYDLTKYLDEKGCPWTIGDSEDDILIGWSDFYDYLSEDRDFKSRFFYSHETHFLESTGRVVGISELFPIRESTTFDLLYKVGDDSVTYNRNMSILRAEGVTTNLKDPKSVLSAKGKGKESVFILYQRGLLSPDIEKEIKESKFYT